MFHPHPGKFLAFLFLMLARSRTCAGTAEYVVVFSTAEACAVHDMGSAHLILAEPNGGHAGVAETCAPECGGTHMGFLSAECVPALLEKAGPRMALYNTQEGCETEDENDIKRIVFNLGCFTISNGGNLNIFSPEMDVDAAEVCSLKMTCSAVGSGLQNASLYAYASEDCTGAPVSTHAARSATCVFTEGMGYTRYTCPPLKALENEDQIVVDITSTSAPSTSNDPTAQGDALTASVIAGVSALLVVLVLVIIANRR